MYIKLSLLQRIEFKRFPQMCVTCVEINGAQILIKGKDV
jgi:hypothetical protein